MKHESFGLWGDDDIVAMFQINFLLVLISRMIYKIQKEEQDLQDEAGTLNNNNPQ
jgi:hypothetical protein